MTNILTFTFFSFWIETGRDIYYDLCLTISIVFHRRVDFKTTYLQKLCKEIKSIILLLSIVHRF